MFRSPPDLRSGAKASRVPLSAGIDKRVKVERSLSDSSFVVTASKDMASKQSKSSSSVATNIEATIEAVVGQYLSRPDVFDGLVAKLKEAVEEAVLAAMTTANQEIARLNGEVAALKVEMKKMEEVLIGRTDDLEQYTRRNNIRIYGVPETKGEDTDGLVVQLCRERLGLEIQNKSISRSHRIGRQLSAAADGKPRHRPIIVRFVSYQDRRLLFNAKKKLKGSGVVMREDLTARRQEVYRRAVEVYGLKNCWTSDGRVLWLDSKGVKGSATKLSDIQA